MHEFITTINSYLEKVVYRLNERQPDSGAHSGTQATPPRPSVPLLSPKLINSGTPSCRTLPLVPIPSSENLATVSPGSRFSNKQTNRPATVPALHPGAAGQGCAPPSLATSRPLQPIEPWLWSPRPTPIAGHALLCPSRPSPALLCLLGLLVIGPAWTESPASSRGPQAGIFTRRV